MDSTRLNVRLSRSAAVLIAAAFGLATAAAAQQPPKAQTPPQIDRPPAADTKKIPEAPAKLPSVPRDRTRGLDFLFGALKAAPDEASAKHVEGRIWALWSATTSDTVSLLMSRAKTALDRGEADTALRLLDSVVTLRPDYIEGWNRRATLYYAKNEYERSLDDIKQVLIREPRHFGALAGLGFIMQELGDEKRALDAFRKALEINPRLERIPDLIKTLSEKVEGRDI